MNELDPVLAKLVDSGLLRPAGGARSEFNIRHALLQQTAYKSLLRSERREIHRCVGLVLQRTLPESEAAELLAHHFDEAQIAELAYRYYLMAADDDYEKYANHEAVEHYRRAFKWLDTESLDRDELIRVHRYYGRALELIGDFEGTIGVLDALIDHGEARDDPAMRLVALIGQARIKATLTSVHDPRDAKRLAQEALDLARQLDDSAAEVRALWVLMLRDLYLNEDLKAAEEIGLEALHKAHQLGDERMLALVVTDVARLYQTMGEARKSLQIADEGYELWQRDGNLIMQMDICTMIGVTSLATGDLDRAEASFEEALELGNEIENPWGSAVTLANASMADHVQGRSGDALTKLAHSSQICERSDLPAAQDIGDMYRAWIYSDLGALERGGALCSSILQRHERLMPWHRSIILALLARIEIQGGQLTQAKQRLTQIESIEGDAGSTGWLWDPVPLARLDLCGALGEHNRLLALGQERLGLLERRDCQTFIPEVLCHMGAAYIALDRPDHALNLLTRAEELASSLGLRRDLWRIYVEQVRVHDQLGQPRAVEQARGRALAEVRTLLEHIRDPQLVQCFQARPRVADLLQRAEGES